MKNLIEISSFCTMLMLALMSFSKEEGLQLAYLGITTIWTSLVTCIGPCRQALLSNVWIAQNLRSLPTPIVSHSEHVILFNPTFSLQLTLIAVYNSKETNPVICWWSDNSIISTVIHIGQNFDRSNTGLGMYPEPNTILGSTQIMLFNPE